MVNLDNMDSVDIAHARNEYAICAYRLAYAMIYEKKAKSNPTAINNAILNDIEREKNELVARLEKVMPVIHELNKDEY